MIVLGATVLSALFLALVMAIVAIIGVASAIAEAALYGEHDCRRAIWEEREARRILRARYAAGQVSREEYQQLSYELEEAA